MRSASAKVASGVVGGGQFLRPGPLWWVFDWRDAARQAGEIGEVLHPWKTMPTHQRLRGLIDEIDKAETDVPNRLLEALGNGGLRTPPGRAQLVRGNRTAVGNRHHQRRDRYRTPFCAAASCCI